VKNGRSVTELIRNWIAEAQLFSIDLHDPRPPHAVVACGDAGT